MKRHQSSCPDCHRWRSKPKVPLMADLPPARLRLLSPPFHSTGVDCFGPFMVNIGRRTEKRWGVIFKCMTTRAVHLELLNSLNTDAFLLALRRFISRRGKLMELHSDRGTNFRGADRELQEAFQAMEPELQKKKLCAYQLTLTLQTLLILEASGRGRFAPSKRHSRSQSATNLYRRMSLTRY